MLHIPILRHGTPYESVDKIQIVHHATGEPVAEVSMANSGLISRDVHRMDDSVLEQFTVKELVAMCKKAGEVFLNGVISIGDAKQSFDDYVRHLSATTGMPHGYCRGNAKKIYRILDEMDVILAGLTRGFDMTILDRGWGDDDGRTLSYYREGRIFGAVLPSNSPGVHSLWAPAVALKTPIVLKPGREEPWTPFRMIQSFIAAGMPAEAFGFYPTDHGGSINAASGGGSRHALWRCLDHQGLVERPAHRSAWPRLEQSHPGRRCRRRMGKICRPDGRLDRRQWRAVVHQCVGRLDAEKCR